MPETGAQHGSVTLDHLHQPLIFSDSSAAMIEPLSKLCFLQLVRRETLDRTVYLDDIYIFGQTIQEHVRQPLAWALVSPTEHNYSIRDKELMEGKKHSFSIYTEHKKLVTIQ